MTSMRKLRSIASQRRQRGAAALFAAIGLIGVLAASAFAIDLAQIYLAQRELQNMANLSALDVARSAGGCLAPDENRQQRANNAALASIARLDGESEWLSGGGVNLGRAEVNSGGLWRFSSVDPVEEGQAHAFEVRLERPFPDLVMPLIGFDADTTPLTARATSMMAPAASFQVGSFLLDVDGPDLPILNELFTQLFDSPVSLSLLSAEALVDSSVELADIAEQLGSTTLEELLTDPISLPGALGALADALLAAGEGTAATAVDALAAAAPNEPVIFGDIVGSPQDVVRAGGEVGFTAMALARALAFQVGDPVLQLTPDISVPGVADVTSTITLGQPPVLGIGPAVQDASSAFLTQARNTQGNVGLAVELLPILGNPATVKLDLEVADAQADLRAIRCAGREREQHEVDLGVETGIARLVINNGPADPLINLGITQICWEGAVNIADPVVDRLTYEGPFNPDDPAIIAANTQTVGSKPGVSLASALNDLAVNSPPYICGPTGLLINPIVQPVLAVVSGLVGPLLQDLIDPLLEPLIKALGVSLGGADVTVVDVFVPPPQLLETE